MRYGACQRFTSYSWHSLAIRSASQGRSQGPSPCAAFRRSQLSTPLTISVSFLIQPNSPADHRHLRPPWLDSSFLNVSHASKPPCWRMRSVKIRYAHSFPIVKAWFRILRGVRKKHTKNYSSGPAYYSSLRSQTGRVYPLHQLLPASLINVSNTYHCCNYSFLLLSAWFSYSAKQKVVKCKLYKNEFSHDQRHK